MNRSRLRIPTPAGFAETLVNDPQENRAGLIFVAHPHPLHGGSMDNKVVQTVAQAAYERGWVAVRPNFRGVGASDGHYDGGIGETADMLALIDFVAGHYPGLPLHLAGFSLGAYVQQRVAQSRAAHSLALIGAAINLYDFGPAAPATRVIHGERDEIVPLAAVRAWTAAQDLPLTVVAQANHFFDRKLGELRAAVEAAWRS